MYGYNYRCITRQGSWKFEAANHIEAMRLALFYCWRDGEDFVSVEPEGTSEDFTLRIILVERDGSAQTL